MTKAELKRRLVPGTKLTLVDSLLGECCKPRTVHAVRSADYIMLTPEGKHSHLAIVTGERIDETPGGFRVVILPDDKTNEYQIEQTAAEYKWGWPEDWPADIGTSEEKENG